jgi:hypothetical protein
MRDYDSLFAGLLQDLGYPDPSCDQSFSGQTCDQVAKAALANSFYKKLCPEGNTEVADQAALEKFCALNEAISEDPFEFVAENEAESCFWDYFLDEVDLMTRSLVFGREFDNAFIRDHMGPGPGAAQKADATCAVTKLFGGPLSYMQPEIIQVYRNALAESGIWAEAEMQRYQEFGFVRVEGVKLFFAPKNREISRTCGTEASIEMLIQKAIGAFLEQGLEDRTGINLSTQPDLNRELARLGSTLWESHDSFCTMDLISASDCISLRLIERCIRNPVLRRMILLSRSQFAILPKGGSIKLKMVSTMGNGFTFPLQTLLFASAVKAVYSVMGIPEQSSARRNYGVFGDDIVVRKPAFNFLAKMLTKLGFRVNKEKSFQDGPFRESCGHDYYAGRNVRGVYVRSLETHPEVISVINRLHRWSAYHGIELPSTLSTLIGWAPKILVPPSESDDAGIHVPFKLTRPKLTSTYWFKYRALKRVTRRVDVPDVSEDEPKSTDLAGSWGFLSGVYRRRDYELKLTDDGVPISPWEGSWSASVSLRDLIGARARYKIVTKSIPFWDFVPIPSNGIVTEQDGPWRLSPLGESYRRWEAIVAASVPR